MKLKSLKSISVVLGAMFICIASTTYATVDGAIIPAVTGGNNGGPIVITDGKGQGSFKMETYNRTKLLDYAQKRSEEDKQHVLEKLNQINDLYKYMYEQQLNNGLISYSVKAYQSSATDAFKFQTAIAIYNKQKVDLENEVASIIAYTQAFLKPTAEADPQIQAYGNLNFNEITQHYLNQSANFDTYLSNLRQYILLSNGTKSMIREDQGNSLSLESIEGDLISSEEIESIQAQILKWRSWGPEDEDRLMDFVFYSQGTMQQFATSYGSEEQFRFINEAYGTERADFQQSLEEVYDIFWLRSFMRLQTGLPIGTFATVWDKNKFNTDMFRDPNKLLVFTDPIGFDSDLSRDYIRQGDAYYNAIYSANSQGINMLNIFDGDVGPLDYINTAAAILNGKKPVVEVSKTLLELLSRDLYEERTLAQTGDLKKLLENYKTSYYDTDEREEKYRQKARNVLGLVDGYEDPEDDGFGSSPNFSAQNSTRGHTVKIYQILDKKTVEVERANAQDKALKEMMRIEKGREGKQRKKRSDALS